MPEIHRSISQTPPPGLAMPPALEAESLPNNSPTALPLAQRFFSALTSIFKGEPHG